MSSMITWIKDHKKEIILVGGTAIVVGGTVWIIKEANIRKLQTVIAEQSDIIADHIAVIDRLTEMCVEKEVSRIELASDALRRGSPLGGRVMASWKEAINAA